MKFKLYSYIPSPTIHALELANRRIIVPRFRTTDLEEPSVEYGLPEELRGAFNLVFVPPFTFDLDTSKKGP